ncbi:MAG: hypothetical protein ACSLEM_02740 [Candidatus Malihini olakiniferum]
MVKHIACWSIFFIQHEQAIYQNIVSQYGFWKGTCPFGHCEKTGTKAQSALIISFSFEPVDGKPVVALKTG